MDKSTFYGVWYLSRENTWKDHGLLAFDDIGPLVVTKEQMEYKGRHKEVLILNSSIRRISIGLQGSDALHKWIRIEYEDDGKQRVVFFSDGRFISWVGILGGTQRLFNQIDRILMEYGYSIEYGGHPPVSRLTRILRYVYIALLALIVLAPLFTFLSVCFILSDAFSTFK